MTEHPTHLSVSEALEIAQKIAPGQTWFTHLCHDLGHANTEAELPAGVRLACDGLKIALRMRKPRLASLCCSWPCSAHRWGRGSSDPAPHRPSREAPGHARRLQQSRPRLRPSLRAYYAKRRSIPLDHRRRAGLPAGGGNLPRRLRPTIAGRCESFLPSGAGGARPAEPTPRSWKITSAMWR